MKLPVLLVLLCTAHSSIRVDTTNILKYIDPRIGSGGDGYGIGSQLVGPQVPFGMMRLGPDTCDIEGCIWIPFSHCGGYWPGDYYMKMLSHTHMVGAGTADYGNIGVFPITKKPDATLIKDYGWKAHFYNENITVGYYSVFLKDRIQPDKDAIWVELTAGRYTGVHRYTFPDTFEVGAGPRILFFPPASLPPEKCSNSSIQIDMVNQEVTGWAFIKSSMSGRFGGMKIYFVAVFAENNKMSSSQLFKDNKLLPTPMLTTTGKNIGAIVNFPQSTKQVVMYLGISFVSLHNAKLNLQQDTDNQKAGRYTFDEIQQHTTKEWSDLLTQIVPTVTMTPQDNYQHEVTTKFYTALYRSCMAPTRFSESNGLYMGFDKKAHSVPSTNQHYYTDMSIWDVHRTQFPWLALVRPDIMNDIVNSLLLMTQQGGSLPKWPMAYGYTSAMIGTHAIDVIVDAYWKNCTNWDHQLAWDVMWRAASQPQKNCGRADIEDWFKLGYIPVDKDSHGVCKTLAYAKDDAFLLSYAKEIHAPQQNISSLEKTSQNFRNVWDNSKQFFCPRDSSGKFKCPLTWIDVFDPHYIEGDAWHWRFCVQGTPTAQISLFGSEKVMVEQLDKFLNDSFADPYNILPNPYYWAGNEEDLFAPWIFNFVHRPDLTQKYTRKILDEKYGLTTGGLPGNDDYGTMSAWLLFATLGFYPQVGTPNYIIGSPSALPKIVVMLPFSGEQLTVETVNGSKVNVYVKQLLHNGKPWKQPFVKQAQFVLGGTWQFTLTYTPTKWFTP